MFGQFLHSENIVNRNYAAACIERFLLRKGQQDQLIGCTEEIIYQSGADLGQFLDEHPSDYGIKALQRIILTAKDRTYEEQ